MPPPHRAVQDDAGQAASARPAGGADRLAAGARPRSFLLAEITNGIPAGVSLLDFELSSRIRSMPAPAPVTAFQQRAAEVNTAAAAAANQVSQARSYDVTMKLTGVATTDVQVAQFITKLNGSELLSEVNLVVSDEFKLGNETMRKFQIEMTLNPAAQVSISDIKKNTNTAAAPPGELTPTTNNRKSQRLTEGSS
jgi:hypothetical protein